MKVLSNKTILFCLLAVICLAGFTYQKAAAQQAAPTPSDDQVNEVARQLYCPVCENIPLDVCPTTACAQWRDLIRQQLAAGKTAAEIKDYFVVQYGDRVLAVPPRRGINWLLYILPPLVIVLGAFVLYLVLRRMRRLVSPLPAAPEPGAGDEYLARVEEALRQRK